MENEPQIDREKQAAEDTARMIASVYARSAGPEEFVDIMATYQTVRVDTLQLYASIKECVYHRQIFEVVDASDDEMFFSMGFYGSLVGAVDAIGDQYDRESAITDSGDAMDFERIEIRSHELDELSDGYRIAYAVERSKKWDDDGDFAWETKVLSKHEWSNR